MVLGASAGGVEALQTIAAGLPANFGGSVLVVLHVPSHGVSVLPRILARKGPLPAVHVTDGMECRAGRIYVAPPNHHLLLERTGMRINLGPRENGHRPAVDPTLRSAASAFGPRVVGVILSGAGDDGSAGLLAVKRAGGVTVVQDPTEASCPSMPLRAAEIAGAHYSLPADEIALLLRRLAGTCNAESNGASSIMSANEQVKADYQRTEEGMDAPSLSGFSCPECGGRLWELQDGGMFRYRCRVGHGYSPDSLVSLNAEALEGALWSALNVLEENAALSRRLALDAHERQHPHSARRFEQRAADSEAQAKLLRQVLDLKMKADAPDAEGAPSEEEITAQQGLLRHHVVNQTEHV